MITRGEKVGLAICLAGMTIISILGNGRTDDAREEILRAVERIDKCPCLCVVPEKEVRADKTDGGD